MAKKELTNNEHNAKVFEKIHALESDIKKLRETLKPVELQEQASLAKCNELARKAITKPNKVNPKLLAEEAGVKK